VAEETRADGILLEAFFGNFNKSSQSLTLRPENTAGVVRAYIENKLGESGQLQKLYYIGPQFRRERPQKGRYRQFAQIGAEVIGPPSAGSESPLRDAEILEMLATLLDELGITGWTLELNSVGSAADRARYNDALRAALAPVVGQMCADCQRRAVTNPLRVLDCKVPADQPIIATLPVIADSLDEASQAHFAAVTEKAAAFVAPLGDPKDEAALSRINAAALALARELRHAGLRVELGEGSFRLKKSFEAADKTARAIVILGEDELQSGILTVKTFSTGIQTKVPRAELAAFLSKPANE
jgi:histidyl-tRNA synthetase